MRRACTAAGLAALALLAAGCGGDGRSANGPSPRDGDVAAAEAGAAERFLASVRGSRVLLAAFHPL